MLSFERLRKVEPALQKIPDVQLERIRHLLYLEAQLALECFLEQDAGSKNIALGSKGLNDEVEKSKPLCKTEKNKTE